MSGCRRLVFERNLLKLKRALALSAGAATNSPESLRISRHFKQSLAAPDPHDADLAGVTAVDDPKRRPDQFPQERLRELRNDPTHVGMAGQRFDAGDDLVKQSVADLGNRLFDIPRPYGFQVSERRLGKADGDFRRHDLLEAEPRLGIRE